MVSLDAVLDHITRLSVAATLALPVGWNRERTERSAGIRTFLIVSVASCAFLLAMSDRDEQALSRAYQGMLTGIGFIGSGAILKHRSRTHGTATAAALWATGAVGANVALGHYDMALYLSLATFAVLRWLQPAKRPAGYQRDAAGAPHRPAG